jgi:hypothetical protein
MGVDAQSVTDAQHIAIPRMSLSTMQNAVTLIVNVSEFLIQGRLVGSERNVPLHHFRTRLSLIAANGE